MQNKIDKEDILKELFNISVGKSASLLSEIINKKIILSVPKLKIIDLNKEKMLLEDYLPVKVEGNIMISSIKFQDQLRGKASLIFPANKMKKLISLCLNESNENFCDSSFTDIDFDIIKEVGNIILNSIIGELANFLKIKLDYNLPKVILFSKEDFYKNLNDKLYKNIVILNITFKIDNTEIEGAVIINISLTSLSQLLIKLQEIEGSFYG